MTREDVKKLFPDATDEQITRLLNQNNSEINVERNKANQYKAEADKVAELQKQIKSLSDQNLTDAQKAQQDLEEAQKRIAQLEKQSAIAAQKKMAMEQFHIDATQADKVITEDGSLDYTALGQIISEKEATAASAKEQEIANNAGNPGGGNSGGGADTRTDAEKIVDKLVIPNLGQTSNDVVKNYLR